MPEEKLNLYGTQVIIGKPTITEPSERGGIDPSISADARFGTRPEDFYVCCLCGKSFHRSCLGSFIDHARVEHDGDVRGAFGED